MPFPSLCYVFSTDPGKDQDKSGSSCPRGSSGTGQRQYPPAGGAEANLSSAIGNSGWELTGQLPAFHHRWPLGVRFHDFRFSQGRLPSDFTQRCGFGLSLSQSFCHSTNMGPGPQIMFLRVSRRMMCQKLSPCLCLPGFAAKPPF